jgi:hypothetical protein
MDTNEDTFIADAPIFAPGEVGKPADSMRIIAAGGEAVQKCISITGAEKFEHMLLFCLKLLDQARGEICAFYMTDFDDCDEMTMKVLQRLIGRSGYAVNDYLEGKEPSRVYKGFWAWQKKK